MLICFTWEQMESIMFSTHRQSMNSSDPQLWMFLRFSKTIALKKVVMLIIIKECLSAHAFWGKKWLHCTIQILLTFAKCDIFTQQFEFSVAQIPLLTSYYKLHKYRFIFTFPVKILTTIPWTACLGFVLMTESTVCELWNYEFSCNVIKVNSVDRMHIKLG